VSRSLRIEVLEDPGRLPGAWDARVHGAGPLLQRRTLSVLDAAALPGTRLLYALAWIGEMLVAAGVFHLVPFEPGRTGRTVAASPWLTGAFLRLTGVLGRTPNLLLCGHWLHTDAQGFVCDVSSVDPAATLDAMVGKVRRHAGRSVALEVVKGVDLPDGGTSLSARGHHRVDAAQPTMRVHVDPRWRDWEDYVGAMHKKYRQRARAARRRGAGLERERLDAQQIGRHAEVIDRLLDAVLENAEVVLTTPRAGTLAALKRLLGSELEVVLYRHEGKAVGFSACWLREDALQALLVGVDADANRDAKLYQNILYDFVERALEARLPVVELGRTALEIKSAVGAEPSSFPIWVHHPNPLLHWLLGLAAARVRPTGWTPRRAFRDEPSERRDIEGDLTPVENRWTP